MLFHFFFFIAICTAKLNVISDDDGEIYLNGNYTIINIHKNLEDRWNLSSFYGVVQKGEIDGFEYFNVSNLIFFDTVDTIYLFGEGYLSVIKLQNMGALVVFVREKIDPPGRRYIFDRYREGLEIPVAAMDVYDAEFLYPFLNETENLRLMITAVPDENSWDDFKPVLLTFNGILVVCSLIPLFVVIRKLIDFIRLGDCRISISVTCLILNLIGDIMRTAGVIIDPYSFITFDVYAIGALLTVLPFVFLLSSGLLITFYWADILRNKTTKMSAFLSSLKIPFYTTIIFLILIHVGMILLAIFSGIDVTIIILLIDFILILSMAIFYISIGYKIFTRLRAMKRAKLVTQLILAAGIWILCLNVFLILYVILNATVEWHYRMLDLAVMTCIWLSRFGISTIFSYLFSPAHNTSSRSKTLDTKKLSNGASTINTSNSQT